MAHVHALTREFPVVSLSLGQGTGEDVLFSRHDRDFPAAVRALHDRSTLSLGEEPPSLEQVVAAFHAEAMRRRGVGHAPAVVEMEDGVLVAAAAGRVDLVRDGLALAGELAGAWPKSRLPLDWPGAPQWLEGLRAEAADADALVTVVAEQIARHKLTGVRDGLVP